MANTCNHTEPCIWSITEDEGAWDAINDGWTTIDNCFMTSVTRRREDPECGNFWITGGIFDIIATKPFPER